MKFQRNAKIFKGSMDVAPFACVFFLLAMFMMMANLVYTPGVAIDLQLPAGGDLQGSDKLAAAVAIDANGRLYYQNQAINRRDLQQKLKSLVSGAPEPMVLVIEADKAVTHDALVRMAVMAKEAGFIEARLATLPRPLPLNQP